MTNELARPIQIILGYAEILLAGSDGALTDVQRRDIEAIQRGAKALLSVVETIPDPHKSRPTPDQLARLSHDLRTQLNTVMGYARVLLKGIGGRLDGEQRAYLEAIHEGGKQLLDLVEDLSQYVRLEAGDFPFKLEYFDVEPVVRHIRHLAANLIRDKPIHLKVEIETDLPKAYGDWLRVQQALAELVTNACLFTEEGTITIRAYLLADERMIEFSVADTGPGIPQEQANQLFEAFWRGDSANTYGLGLGLYIAKALVERQDGTLRFESQLGTGSTFYVRIPTEPGTRSTQTKPN